MSLGVSVEHEKSFLHMHIDSFLHVLYARIVSFRVVSNYAKIILNLRKNLMLWLTI